MGIWCTLWPMARRSRMSILKRQRELKKSEKAADKRARRHGLTPQPEVEPLPTVGAADLLGPAPPSSAGTAVAEAEPEEAEPEEEPN